MRKLIVTLALVGPALAFAAQKAPPAPPQGQAAAPDDAARWEHMQKRMRMARTLGLAEALDLDEAGAMKARDVLVKYDDKAGPLRKQLRDGEHVLRDAAHGNGEAAAQVDATLKKLRDARAQLASLDADLLQQLTQGMTPEKKARAALFLAHFGRRAGHPGPEGGPGRMGPGGFGPGMGPGGMRGPRGMGPGLQGRGEAPGAGPRGPGGPAMAGAMGLGGFDGDDDPPAFGDDE